MPATSNSKLIESVPRRLIDFGCGRWRVFLADTWRTPCPTEPVRAHDRGNQSTVASEDDDRTCRRAEADDEASMFGDRGGIGLRGGA